MSYAKMTTPALVGFHIVEDRVEEPFPGEISIQSGCVVEITGTTLSTDRPNQPTRRTFNAQLFDLATKEPLDRRPTLLRSPHAALCWWKSVAPDAPIPEELQQLREPV